MVPNPNSVKTWIDLAKDFVLMIVGIFIIIHETVGVDPPSVFLLLIAASALGLPVADRISTLRRNGKKD